MTVPVSAAGENGASADDYSGVPASVTFNSGDTSKSFSFSAVADAVDDDGESVALAFGTLPTGVTAGTTSASTVSITDNDLPAVTVSFGAATYSVAEGGTVDVTVTLDAAPEREVTIPITATDEGGTSADDYSGVPASVTFGAADTSKSFTVAADPRHGGRRRGERQARLRDAARAGHWGNYRRSGRLDHRRRLSCIGRHQLRAVDLQRSRGERGYHNGPAR